MSKEEDDDLDAKLFGAGNDAVADAGPEVEPETVQPEPPAHMQGASPVMDAPVQLTVPPGYIPSTALLDERDKRKDAQRERDDLRKQLDAFKAPRAAPEAPNMFADPDGYNAHQQRQMAEALWQNTVRTSELIAAQTYGAEEVAQAKAWQIDREGRDPTAAQAIMGQSHPLDFAVKEYRRHQLIDGIDWSDPVAAARAIAVKAGLTLSDAPPAVPLYAAPPPAARIFAPATPRTPPASMVSVPAAPVAPPGLNKAEADFEMRMFGKA